MYNSGVDQKMTNKKLTLVEATILTSQAHLALAIAGLTPHETDKRKLQLLAESLTEYVKYNS